jgi:LAO/AO transport system kinase
MTGIGAHWAHLAANGRLAVSRHRQSEGWVHEALAERFGARGLARLASLGLDASLPAGAQPFVRLHELTERLEKTR